MPFQFEDVTSPHGIHYLCVRVSGHVGIADGHALAARIEPGQPHHGGLILSCVAKGTEYSPEVRKFFPSLRERYVALAAVVTNPIVRAAINLMMRLTDPAGGAVRMFTSEPEAVAWLESQAR